MLRFIHRRRVPESLQTAANDGPAASGGPDSSGDRFWRSRGGHRSQARLSAVDAGGESPRSLDEVHSRQRSQTKAEEALMLLLPALLTVREERQKGTGLEASGVHARPPRESPEAIGRPSRLKNTAGPAVAAANAPEPAFPSHEGKSRRVERGGVSHRVHMRPHHGLGLRQTDGGKVTIQQNRG
jgi:hypothetical protein